MGEILLTTLGDALGGAVPVNASVTAVASRVRTDGAEVTAPATVRVHVRDGVPDAPFVLDASGPDWYWTFTIRFVNIARSVVRHVAVPEGVVEWGDLVEVDPATYQPADPTPTLLETINTQVAAYLVENPAASPEQIEQAVTAWLAENPIEGVTQAQLDAAVAGLARSADLAQVATSGAYTDLDGLPALDFAPTVHTHEIGDVTGLEDALANAGGGDGGLSGTGSPEGSRPATVGTIYTDTAATTGAIRWIKASGTGVTGWKVLYGDTGWRDVSAGLTNVTAGKLYFRRVNDLVHVRAGGIATTGHAIILAPIPDGFRPISIVWGTSDGVVKIPLGAGGVADAPTWLTVESGPTAGGSAGRVSINAATVAVRGTGEGNYITPQPWPTILPGTAA